MAVLAWGRGVGGIAGLWIALTVPHRPKNPSLCDCPAQRCHLAFRDEVCPPPPPPLVAHELTALLGACRSPAGGFQDSSGPFQAHRLRFSTCAFEVSACIPAGESPCVSAACPPAWAPLPAPALSPTAPGALLVTTQPARLLATSM